MVSGAIPANSFASSGNTGNSVLPLKDIRVIDMGTVVAAPFAAMFLVDFGAEVIKVENPDVPHALRGWGVVEGVYQTWYSVIDSKSCR